MAKDNHNVDVKQRIAEYCKLEMRRGVDFRESQVRGRDTHISGMLQEHLGLSKKESDALAQDIVHSVHKELYGKPNTTTSIWSGVKAFFSTPEAIKFEVIQEVRKEKPAFLARTAASRRYAAQYAEEQSRNTEFVTEEVQQPPVFIQASGRPTINLMDAALNGNHEGVKAALKRGEDINARGENGKTALTLVIEKICSSDPNHPTTMQLENVMQLLTSNARVDLRDADDAVSQMISRRNDGLRKRQDKVVANRPINAYLDSAESNPDVVKQYVACCCFCEHKDLKTATAQQIEAVTNDIFAALQKHPDLKGKSSEAKELAKYIVRRVHKELEKDGDRSLISRMSNYIDAKLAKFSPARAMKRQMKKAARIVAQVRKRSSDGGPTARHPVTRDTSTVRELER